MIDVSALKTTIANLLVDELGEYRFLGGNTPAIRIDDGSSNAQYTNEPTIIGLEVVIRPERDIEFFPMLAGDRRLTYRSEIVLKQWDSTKTTQAARDILFSELDDLVSVGPIVPRSTRLDTIESCTLVAESGFYVMRSA